jgi:hypothetical protein
MKTKILFTFLSITSTCFSFAQTKIIQNQKPNIVFILAEDMGYGDVSALNENSKLQTLHIDAVAKEGMKFIEGHSNSAYILLGAMEY